MADTRPTKRDSAGSRLTAILNPLPFYEPLTLAQLEEARQDALDEQTQLPHWTKRASMRSERPPPSRARSSMALESSSIHTKHASLMTTGEWDDFARSRQLLASLTNLEGKGGRTLTDGDDTIVQTPEPARRRSQRSRSSLFRSKPRDPVEAQDPRQPLVDRSSYTRAHTYRRSKSKYISALPQMPLQPQFARSGQGWSVETLTEEKKEPETPESGSPNSKAQKTSPGPGGTSTGGPPFGGPPFGGPPSGPPDPSLVVWRGSDDPGNPMNWPRSKKWACTIVLALVTFCVTFASSVFSAGTVPAAEEFHTSREVMLLPTTLFVLGFAFGPILWGPMSELYGRKIPLTIGFTVFAIFQIPVAVAQNLPTLFACRFLAGFFGCAPLSVVGGALADFWDPISRGVAASVFACAVFLGPTMGPIVGAFLSEAPMLGFRWTSWVTLMISGLCGLLFWFVFPESFGPVLLKRRARALRFETKNWALHAPAEEHEIDLKAILSKYLSKPFMMLAMEPILLLVTVYMSFIYGLLYLFFVAFPISYEGERHWGPAIASLPFAAVAMGVAVAGLINFAFTKLRFARIMQHTGRLPPEERLLPMAVGAVALPVGLFWFAWTSSPDLMPVPQIMSGLPAGTGIVLIFLQGLNYIIDVYMMHANSALAGNTFVRSLFGAGFPMFASYMYHGLGVKWATSVLGFIAVGLMPVPLLFFIYGARIRKMSRFVPNFPPRGGPPGSVPMGPPPLMGAGVSPATPRDVEKAESPWQHTVVKRVETGER
ncbi:hypothetical protein B0A48_02426 [Cryoendolithus antarcticus]|uniref:Cercosporin MFS transporter CTB4 n=1 Tax=Cryoendolithus antarcticus TaxID=1507870 RepID=A0A1V8TP29_9PEZI|nr:hypothetical protein B0A48_02426 [Cryoendolithus antarcticus]